MRDYAKTLWAEHRRAAIIAAAIILVVTLVIGAWNVDKWPRQTGFNGRSLYDVLELLVVPFALAIVAYFFSRREQKDEREIAKQRRGTDLEIAEGDRQEATLQAYLDRMAELLLEEKLNDPTSQDEVRAVARARTATAVRRLNTVRNEILLQFLYDADLIAKDDPVQILKEINLSGANLSRAYLSGANLSEANLSEAKLSRADLSEANLSEADLSGADLSRAYLSGADLSGAYLSGADLSGAYLGGAYLGGADLSGAYLGGAYLGGADLRGTDLRGADLSGAYLRGADLSGAYLIGADLIGADLIGADLIGADLIGAEVAAEQLARVLSLEGATMPDGIKHS